MKRHLNNLLQYPRGRFEGAHAAHRTATSRNPADTSGLRPEDGYDWLLQIKLIQAGRAAARR
jgi:hypothetical protein